MKSESEKLLYQVLEKRLLSTFIEDDGHDEFISCVVAEYLIELRSKMSVPQAFLEDVRSETEEQVRDMLRKKTYGHYDLQHFKKRLSSS